MKIVQNALFRSCAARFGQIAFLIVKVLEIVTMAWNSHQNRKTVPFPWKLYKTIISGHSGTFWPYRILEGDCFQNRETGLKFSSRQKNSAVAMKVVQSAFLRHAQHVLAKSQFWPSKFSKSSHWPEILLKREKSALSIKIVQNALFRSCLARFGQIAFWSVNVLKIVKLASNSLQNRKTVRFLWKLYKKLFSGHAQHVLAKSHFSASKFSNLWKFSKSSHWPKILYKTVKQCAFYENCTKRFFQVMRSTFWPNRIFERQFLKIVKLAWKSLQNGKTVRFS